MLASFLLISSVFYAVVALTGRKPEYHTLMSVCVYAGFVELAAIVLQLAMMVYYQTTNVDTSLQALGGDSLRFLGAIDPFRIWFWVLVCLGLMTTHQLGRRSAIATCVLLGGVALGVRITMIYLVSAGA